MFSPEVFVGGSNFIGFAVGGNFAVFNEDGAVTELTDVFHGMGDEDDSLVAMKAGEIIITFSLKAASPTARTSSRMRISPRARIAIEKARRTCMPEE